MKLLSERFALPVKKFGDDEDGATALTFALGLVTLLGAVGMGMDISVASNNKIKAQSIADAVSLNAAVFVRDNNRAPLANEDGYQNGVTYTATEAGFDFGSTVIGDVTIKVDYDMAGGTADVTVEGDSKTSLTSLFGYQKIDFKASATASFFEANIKSPASIVFVADNSGSMAWLDKALTYNSTTGLWERPTDGETRINALETATKQFMTDLDTLVGPQNVSGERVLRTGLLAFDSDIITSRTVTMDWGILSNGEIEAMSPSGATNSSPPMAEAKVWLDGESTHHSAETGESPLRYAIFLTDGVNTAGGYTWHADSSTDYWRKCVCGYFSCYWQHYTSSYDWTSYGYEEGEYRSNADTQTSATCTAMKNAGYRVFSIGFALKPGWYYDGTGSDTDFDNYERIYQSDTDKAYALLSGCASSGSDFVAADDAQQLRDAFTTIGNTIVEEVIRLSN